jgi:hypothetical protein
VGIGQPLTSRFGPDALLGVRWNIADREKEWAINYHLKGGRPLFAAKHVTDAQRSIKLLAALFIASASARRAAIVAQLFGFFLSFMRSEDPTLRGLIALRRGQVIENVASFPDFGGSFGRQGLPLSRRGAFSGVWELADKISEPLAIES